MKGEYYVYILTNGGGTVLYVGITNNLAARVDQHAAGEGGAFSRKYQLKRLLYFETYVDVRQAIAREKQIKGWSRRKKESLIRTMNPRLENLRHTLRMVPR